MTKQILFSLLNCSWQWMLLGGLTWLITSSVFRKKRRSNTTVHLLWLLSLLSLPILFGLNQFVPALSISGPVPELTQVHAVDISGLTAQTAELPEIASPESNTQFQGHAGTGRTFFSTWTLTDLILSIWVIGTLIMLVRLAFGLYRIHQLRRSAVVADDSYQAICQRFARQLNIKRPVTVCFSDRVVSPISFGWLAPCILIPRTLNLEPFELVAAHELAHVQRLDWLTNLFSHLVGVIFFFHPIYHFLNRELVRVRERICDDWVIRLTGARKNYAQCLLDLVRHEERTVSLALSLNQPSQLESRIDSILKNNRRLDVQLKPRLRLIAATLLLTCLPLLATAQLVPLKTFQVSLFAQTPQHSEKAVDKTEKKPDMGKAKTGKMDGKQYKDESHITVKAPVLLEQSAENRIFSGPQPGEKLPPLTVTGVGGRIDGTTFDMTTKADGKPLILFLQDTNAVGIKGLVNVFKLLLQIDAHQKKQSQATGTETPNQGLQIGVVFLADNLDTLPEWARNMLKEEIPNVVLTGLSPDGREGPGSYGLNRNVAQTVLIAKDGQVLHNFAFTQPMLRPDPYVLGAVGEAIGIKPATLEKWLNPQNPVIEIKNPAEGGKTGEMLLNGNIVQFDELLAHLLNLPDEQKSTLIIQSGRDVPHEQIVKVMDIAKEAGIDKIEFAMRPSENKRMESGREQMRREYSDEIAALRKRISEATKKVEEMRKQVEETRKRHEDAVPNREQHGNED
ncbi:MAG: biopolymer transporter ExbD [Candidatus Poribacteria bacterium]|nr:biopolymer transporter ExbD [Candidatus Poribacteria bacterium]